MTATREPTGPEYYTVRPVGANGDRPHGGINSEATARGIARHYIGAGASYVSVERQESMIAEYGTRPSSDDAIGRDYARRQRELDAARVALTAARERGEGAGTIRRLAAEVERLEYME